MEKKKGLFQRLREGLTKTRDALKSNIDNLISYYKNIDDDFFDDLEAVLITSDMGAETAMALIEDLRARVKKEKIGDPARVRELLMDAISARLEGYAPFELKSPTVLLVIGVNGVGKTTTIGKLAAQFRADGKNVMIAAADTFRAAAIDQLKTWAQRAGGVPVIAQSENSDPAAVVFDAVSSAKAKNANVLLIDTAGRLHNKKNLMNELEKINRVIDREWPEANRETFLVLDATTGQNALNQVRLFNEAAKITGVVLTKLDGTAKGGVVVAIESELCVPVRFAGVGEGVDDLQVFDSASFVRAMFGIKEASDAEITFFPCAVVRESGESCSEDLPSKRKHVPRRRRAEDLPELSFHCEKSGQDRLRDRHERQDDRHQHDRFHAEKRRTARADERHGREYRHGRRDGSDQQHESFRTCARRRSGL